MRLKSRIRKMPLIGNVVRKMLKILKGKPIFHSSRSYWEERYKKGGGSGAGSYNRLAEYKANVINSFIKHHNIESVIEFGSGDGNQLKYFEFNEYLGFDVSITAIQTCREIYKKDDTKKFKLLSKYQNEKAELVLSLDVIYHLVEEPVFESHLRTIFSASTKYVIIYSSNKDDHENNGISPHVKHRNFTRWVKKNVPNFKLKEKIPNKYPFDGNGERSSYADFYIFEINT